MTHTYTKVIMIAALVCVLLFLVRIMFLRNKDDSSAINLDDLLIGEDGKLSKSAVVMLGAFVMTTWVIIHLTIVDKLTEGYLTIYAGAWISPTVTKLIFNK